MASLLKHAARVALHRSGLMNGVRRWNSGGFRILTYHQFPASVSGLPEALAKQCEHLRRHYQPVSMRQIAERLAGGAELPRNAVAVTVDDGYRDFYLVGHPVFQKFGIPVTMYVVSGFLDQELWLWLDQVRWAVENCPLANVSVELPGGALQWNGRDDGAKRDAGRRLGQAMKRMKQSERLRLMKELPSILQVSMPEQPPEHLRPLQWDEVRRLSDAGVEFGGHSHTHPILSAVTDGEELEMEVALPKKRLEAELDREAMHFCYPNGGRDDFNEETVRAVERAGYGTAVTTLGGRNQDSPDRHRLQRIMVEPMLPQDYFEELVAGLH